jgi:ribosomal protein L11 methylase PrmA
MSSARRDRSSFRDERGFVFWQDGELYRQVNEAGREAYDQLMDGGLYEQLQQSGLLVAHEDTGKQVSTLEPAYKVIKPDRVPFISYPYEWSFSQYKDAALATLEVQKMALAHGMVLRDASAYNVQFVGGRPLLIDTLSFGEYKAGEPWTAYRQFCQHFLAPLALAARVDPALTQLMRVYIDGVPLPLAAKLLPLSSRVSLGLYTHISLHARFQKRHESAAKRPAGQMSRTSLEGMIANLESTVRALKLRRMQTEWADYYQGNNNYTDDTLAEKTEITKEFMLKIRPERVIDLGANDGRFSRAAASLGAFVVSADIDPMAVEANWLKVKKDKVPKILPVLVDLTNPGPGLGWANQERSSFGERATGDVALALALIHHLAIANNLPMEMVAEYFATLAPALVIEFVPKSDSQVKKLLATREDIFHDYTEEGFERAFLNHFRIAHKRKLREAERTIYLMERKRG